MSDIRTYDESNIETNIDITYVRLRPTGYINDTDQSGQVHIAKEIIDNAVDELELMGPKGILNVVVFNDYNRKTYQVLISDNGRGIPLGKLYDIFIKLQTSGKFNTKAYKFSSGSFGVGAKVTVGLSKHFKALAVHRDVIGELVVHDCNPPDEAIIHKYKSKTTGTFVLFEPDKTIFTGIDSFMEDGFHKLTELLQIFNLFSNYQIRLSTYPTGISQSIWDTPGPEALPMLHDYSKHTVSVFNNTTDFLNPHDFIKRYFNIIRPFAWEFRVSKPIDDSSLAYDIMAYAVKYEELGGQLSLVNSVPMRDADSSHLVQFIQTMKKLMGVHISQGDVKEFFFKTYKLPLFLCMSIKWEGATFIGKQKYGFKDAKFSQQFGKELTKVCDPHAIKKLYDIYAEDIQAKFIVHTTGNIQTKSTSRLFLDLKRPKQFVDCSTINRAEAELFLTEGESANSTEGRDSRTQASYSLRGKPLNPITTKDNIQNTILKLQRSDIYQDIMTITGLHPGLTDFSKLRYGKIFIMADADVHGKHIANIIVSNLYSINPMFIESGILHIVTPPLYGMKLKGKRGKDDRMIYIRNAEEMIVQLALNVYYVGLQIGIISKGVFDTPKVLNKPEFVDLCKIVIHVGDIIERLAKQHSINPIILEQLTYVSYYLTPKTMDIDVLKERFMNPDIKYNKINNILVMPIGREDIIISLYALCDSLYNEVLPFLNKIAWKDWSISVTTKHTDYYKNEILSIVQLYQIFKTFDSVFTIERWKGLGSMNPLDRAITCMHRDYRSTYQITSVGDIDTIFELMGKDSSFRKTLIDK